LNLIKATEAGGYTTVDFDRDAMTGDNAKDVQFAVTFKSLLTASDDFTKQNKKYSWLVGT